MYITCPLQKYGLRTGKVVRVSAYASADSFALNEDTAARINVLANDGKANSGLATVTLTVKPVNDAPVANNAAYTLQKDGIIKIDLRSLTSDVDGDCLTIAINNPGKGTLTKNADGTYTYRPRQGYTGADSFSYTVSDGKLTSTGSISLTVRASQRNDDDHCHSNSSNSSNNRSASVTVTSSASSNSKTSRSNDDNQGIHYVVINSANSHSTAPASSASSNALAVNWQAGSTSQAIAASPPSQGNSWLNQLLSTDSKNDKNDLSQKTGLKVKL
jgi:Bacterial Ig domain